MELPAQITREQIRQWLELPVTRTIAAALKHRRNNLKKDLFLMLEDIIQADNEQKALRETSYIQGLHNMLDKEILQPDYLKVIVNDIRALSPKLNEDE